MAFLKQLGALTGIILFLLGCGQQTMNDKGLDTKSISDAASSGSSSSGSSGTFSVSSVDPQDSATSVSLTPTITITFNDNVRAVNETGSNITAWSTTSSTPSSCSSGFFEWRVVQVSSDNFTKCIPDNGTVSGKTITLKLNGTLSSSTTYKIKVRKESIDDDVKLKSTSGTELASDQTYSFTTQ